MSGLTGLFVSIALKAVLEFGVATDCLHLDSLSFHVRGDYQPDTSQEVSVVRKTAITV